ncbi:hypothetical protein BT69DRAFT_161102 [Atractiella rhizophila]|nr:hypothetical protein BT69DRAFT_161102 [Atractiella rhizophila]
MPVTFHPCSKLAEPVNADSVSNPLQHLQQTQFGDIDNADQIVPEIFQCSVSPTDYRDGAILPQSNGFVVISILLVSDDAQSW